MSGNYTFENINTSGYYIEYGPVSAVFSVIKDGSNVKKIEKKCFQIIKHILEDLKYYTEIFKLKACKINVKKNIPFIVKHAVTAVKSINGYELTPLAAVAGAVADSVVLTSSEKERFDRMIFNNGGDIAIECRKKESLPYLNVSGVKGQLMSLKIKGIATSGLRGRSFSKGIADSVTVFAKSGAVADAAATYIANNVIIDSPEIRYEFAHKIDDSTDLKGEKIVTYVGCLSESEQQEALCKGLNVADTLCRQGKIFAAFLRIKNFTCYTEGIENFFKEEEYND